MLRNILSHRKILPELETYNKMLDIQAPQRNQFRAPIFSTCIISCLIYLHNEVATDWNIRLKERKKREIYSAGVKCVNI